jgi:tetratricopeptide (TPR) repeat protein
MALNTHNLVVRLALGGMSLVSFWYAQPTFGQPTAQVIQKKKSNPVKVKTENKEEKIIPKTEVIVGDIKTLYNKKLYKEVVNQYSPKIETLDRSSLIDLSKSYLALEDSPNSIKVLNLLYSRSENDVEVLTLLGQAHLKSGKKGSDALNAFKNALEINPKYEPAYEGLVEVYEKQKNQYELRILLQDMVEKIAPRKRYLTKLCNLCLESNLYDIAKKYCQLGTRLFPEEAENFVRYGQVIKVLEDSKNNGDQLIKKAAEDFKNSELANYTYANLLEEKKDFVTAFSFFQKAVNADPSSIRSQIGLAKSAFELKKYDIALEAFKASCKKDKVSQSELRKKLFILKTEKNADWIAKYESALETCSPSIVGF